MPEKADRRGVRVVYAVLAALALLQGGCLAVGLGVAAGGAAAVGYAYYKGSVYHDFPATVNDSLAAAHAALLDMQFPILAEENKGDKGFIASRTGDGRKVSIHLTSVASPIPAEGIQTRISVRVSAFGNEEVSTRILDQITRHLAPPPLAVPQVVVPPVAVPPAVPPVAVPRGAPTTQSAPRPTVIPTTAARTAEPPLAPPEPVPVK
jgi:hypothetical protein